jgi:hypothetical protein
VTDCDPRRVTCASVVEITVDQRWVEQRAAFLIEYAQHHGPGAAAVFLNGTDQEPATLI